MSWGVATQNGVSVSLASIVSISCGATEFSPYDLFTSGVAGAWYDPSDYSTLFQDSAGTTPVTAVEQPVGLMLDKSQGLVLGSELVVNGDFATDTGWTKEGGTTISGGVAVFNGTPGSSLLYRSAAVVIGKTYKITFTVTSRTSGTLTCGLFGGTFLSVMAPGTYVFYSTPTTTNTNVGFYSSGGFVGTSDDISIKELPGNHASQATSASRPILRARYNLLTYSEQFDNAAWVKQAITATANTITENTTSTTHQLAPASGTFPANVQGIFSIEVKPNGRNYVTISWANSGSHFAAFYLSGTGSIISNQLTGIGAIELLSDGYYRISFTNTPTIAGANFYGVNLANAAYPTNPTPSYTGDGVSGVFVRNADLRTGSSAGTYQRIAAATDYATAGFLPYLAGDGVDDQMVIPTAAISGATAITELHGAWRPTGFASSNGTIFGGIGTGTTNDHEPFSDNVLYYGFASTSRQDFGSLGTVTTPYILDATQTGTTLAAFKNNVQLSTTKTVALGIGTTPRLFLSNNATSYFYAGNLFGGVLIQKVLSASEMASLRSWMAAKSGVTL